MTPEEVSPEAGEAPEFPAEAPAKDGPRLVEEDFNDRVEHGYADNAGVKVHYATLGEGPLLVMLHGFPDFWYTWRYQMEVLSESYRTVALDLRGYNLSDKPEGVENYDMRLLVGDVVAVVRSLGYEKAIVCGHDWGGAIAWQFAMHVPEMLDGLVILNVPHPRGLARELANNPEQYESSAYTRRFQEEGAHRSLTAEKLVRWVTDPSAREKYLEAMRRSDFEAMLHYYKRSYPREPYKEVESPVIKVRSPVLQIHGLEDPYLLPATLNGTWDWVDNNLTLVTVPGAGHFVQQDAPELVAQTLESWLSRSL